MEIESHDLQNILESFQKQVTKGRPGILAVKVIIVDKLQP
jgi:hypothetical protein